MKSVLSDFYDVAVLSDVKRQLMVDLDNLDIPAKRPHIPSRRDGDGRLEKEVNDIINQFIRQVWQQSKYNKQWWQEKRQLTALTVALENYK